MVWLHRNAELAEQIKRLRDHGAAILFAASFASKPYLLADHPDAGYNQRMTDIQGAIGAAQMDRANAIVAERRRLAAIYNEAFADIEWLQTPSDLKDINMVIRVIMPVSAQKVLQGEPECE